MKKIPINEYNKLYFNKLRTSCAIFTENFSLIIYTDLKLTSGETFCKLQFLTYNFQKKKIVMYGISTKNYSEV